MFNWFKTDKEQVLIRTVREKLRLEKELSDLESQFNKLEYEKSLIEGAAKSEATKNRNLVNTLDEALNKIELLERENKALKANAARAFADILMRKLTT